MKKIWIGILVVALLFTSFPGIVRAEEGDARGGGAVSGNAKSSGEKMSSENPEEPREFPDEEEYPVLGTAADRAQFREFLQKGMEASRDKFAIEYTGSDPEELETALQKDLKDFDHEGYFFFGTEYWQWMAWSGSSDFAVAGKLFRFTMNYLQTAEEEKLLNEMVEEVLFHLVDEDMSDYEKVTAVHDYIVLTKYKGEGSSPYELIANGHTSEDHYALLGYKMLQKLGMPVQLIVDGNYNRLWLKVQLNGEWYNLDIYGDEDEPEGKDSLSYRNRYRLVSDAKLNETHVGQSPYFKDIPEATSTKYDAQNDGSKVTLADYELEEFLYRVSEKRVEREILNGFVEVKPPFRSFGNREEFIVKFNEEVDESAFVNIELYRLVKGKLEKEPFTPSVKGAVVTLKADSMFPLGTYYVVVKKGIQAPSGKLLGKSYYQKIRDSFK